MDKLEPPDSHYLRAAAGWLELGDDREASAELEKIAAPLRGHPHVLSARWQISAKAGKWEQAWDIGKSLVQLAPQSADSWVNAAYAARRTSGGGLQAAYAALLPAFDLHSEEPIVAFNLACYSCQLGNLAEALGWLEKAFATGDAKQLKLMALSEPDLAPLRGRIDEML